jgi:hypothetical protein
LSCAFSPRRTLLIDPDDGDVTDLRRIEIVVWSCTASSLFVADVVLQVRDWLRMRPRATKAARVALALESVQIFRHSPYA